MSGSGRRISGRASEVNHQNTGTLSIKPIQAEFETPVDQPEQIQSELDPRSHGATPSIDEIMKEAASSSKEKQQLNDDLQ